MKLLCVNNSDIPCKVCGKHFGTDLEAGVIYETEGEPFEYSVKPKCTAMVYYIKDFGPRLVSRFTKALVQSETQAISYSKKDLDKAVAEEDYTLAETIHKSLEKLQQITN